MKFFGSNKLKQMINNYHKWFKLDFEIVYFFNVYGPNQIYTGEYATVVAIFERQFLNIEQGGGLPRLDRIKIGIHNLNYHLKYIESLLNDRFCLVAENINNADLTAAAHLSCLDYLGDIPWKRYPRVKEWYAKIKSRPSFRSLLTDQIMSIPPRGKYVTLDF